jgi:uncharacterized protein (TIGR02246 family)
MSGTSHSNPADEHAIRERMKTWMKATQSGDTDKVLSLMTEDAVFLVAGQKPFGKGRGKV